MSAVVLMWGASPAPGDDGRCSVSATQTWRVVLAPRTPDGAAEERQLTVVWVERFGGTWTCGGHGYHRSPRRAAMMAAFTLDYDVAEILAPGESTRAELVAGRTTPPTDEEIAAHSQAHPPGLWVTRDDWGNVVVDCGLPSLADLRREQDEGTRWIPVDAAGRSCAWPMPSEGGAA